MRNVGCRGPHTSNHDCPLGNIPHRKCRYLSRSCKRIMTRAVSLFRLLRRGLSACAVTQCQCEVDFCIRDRDPDLVACRVRKNAFRNAGNFALSRVLQRIQTQMIQRACGSQVCRLGGMTTCARKSSDRNQFADCLGRGFPRGPDGRALEPHG